MASVKSVYGSMCWRHSSAQAKAMRAGLAPSPRLPVQDRSRLLTRKFSHDGSHVWRRSLMAAASSEAEGSDGSSPQPEDSSTTSTTPAKTASSCPKIAAIEQELIALCAATNRGQSGSNRQKEKLNSLVEQLEGSKEGIQNPAESEALNGEWLLIYSSENPTRSSPFFWAFRRLCEDVNQPLPGLPPSLSEALFVITDGIPFAKPGQARHTITGAGTEGQVIELTSRVDLTLSVMDAFLPPSIGVVTSTALLEATSGTEHDMTIMTTAVKDSNWARLPPLQFMNTFQFPSQQVLDGLRMGSATAIMATTYLSNKLRVTQAAGITMVHLRDEYD